MARGKKTKPEDIYRVMVSYAITHNNMETARQLGIPESTVRKIVEDNKNSDEFRKLCEEKSNEFAEKTSRIIDSLLERIEKEVLDDEKDIPLNHLTTAMGTLYDKRALSRGETTQNIDFATNFDVEKLIDIAGYTKKDENK
jgi:Asp-tRNA(Asn)/Glu-tRNA(Gln) amidotransferase B subunit